MTQRNESPPAETCKKYVSVAEPECGEPAVAKVKVRTRTGQVLVPLCPRHKAEHDETFARIRTERGGKRAC